MPITLKYRLAGWTNTDEDCYCVALALGVVRNAEQANIFGGKKWIFWSANPMGGGLWKILAMLTKCGVLEHDEEEKRYRWNPNFDWASHGETSSTPR